MSDPIVHGDTANLKSSQARALQRLGARQVPPTSVISAVLARDLLELSHQLNRQLGLFIDRRGRVQRVILGDAHSLALPEFTRVRGQGGRLRGVRLVLTHLVPDPPTREELADLAKLRLDLLAAIHRGPAGVQIDLASLAPPQPGSKDIFVVRGFPRVPLGVLARDDDDPGHTTGMRPAADMPSDFLGFIRDLEAGLVAATAGARAESQGTRAMALMIHQGEGPELHAREQELRELCRTDGLHLVDLATQRRPGPDPRTFFGQGKLRDVLVRALAQDVELLICDPDLTPSQAREIGERTDLKVIDRTTLILDIFAQHATSADGKLQVELAQLRYLLPRMIGHGTAMSRLAGGIGGRGPGETKLEIDRRRAKERIHDLERRLLALKQRRDQRRALRRRTGVPVVAIVGYTNAGKSSLLNTVTDSAVVAEDKLFATLDPSVRRIRFPKDYEVVLLDTVGFIRDLPPALVQAFSATLEEVAEADLLLVVVDASDPDQDQQRATVEAILGEIGAGAVPRLWVYNKIDRLGPDELNQRRADADRHTYFISANERRSTAALMRAIDEQLWERGVVERARAAVPEDSSAEHASAAVPEDSSAEHASAAVPEDSSAANEAPAEDA
ncbi:MAG: GTPase HflX [Nannocystis sp.]|uniref:GTPase HflX n=1 Tax=Nannocystis sp. TaxID=1962667 RepID=UPI002424C099|nr:GTPase HflX [Nannocystis sp.]MBK9754181.1 GTPase HflX [Nannocystis sp.]